MMHLRTHSNTLKQQVPRQPSTWSGGELIPGVGTSDLRLGCSVGEVEALLGSPDQKLEFPGQYFYVYKKIGVDVDFGRPGGPVARLFFYEKGIDGHTTRAPIEIRGLTPGTSMSVVRARLGEPARRGGPVRVGRRSEEWFYYNSGVQFDFDSHQRVITISVNTPNGEVV